MKPKQRPSAVPNAASSGLDWDAYRIILMVGRYGSLSAAARHLGVDQATVGRKLKRAEDTMGAKFFDRMNSGLFATEAGQSIIECAKQIEGIETDPETVPLPYIAMSSTAPERDANFLLNVFPNAKRVACCSGMDTSIPLMKAGLGAARVANFMIPQLTDISRLIECEDAGSLTVWVLTLPDYRATKRIKLFMEFLRDQYSK